MPSHLPCAVMGRVHVLLVDEPHQRQIEFGLTRRLVVEPRPADPNQLALASNRQRRMAAVDHLPPSIDAQRPKAFAKKSRSTTNWPIFACSFSMSSSRVLPASGLPSKTVERFSSACFFQALTMV